MSRDTIQRRWTTEQYDLADKIIDIVYDTGTVVGALSLVRALGMPYGKQTRKRSLRTVYDVTPLAVQLSIQRYPGKVMLYDHTVGTYEITDAKPKSKRVALNRFKKIHTMARRASAELEPLRGDSSLVSTVLVNAADNILNQMPDHLFDALIVASSEGNGEQRV